MTETEIAPLLRFFKALAHESRLRLLGFLAQRARTVQELASLLGLTEPTTSHHLGLLREAGLVTLRVEGNLHWYNFEPSELAPLAKSVLSRQNVAHWAAQARAEKPDRQIQNYLESDGRLRLIPASRKKRYPVLVWLAAHFDLDRRYREAEVNQILQTRYWDSATLRRELVGYRMLTREKGIYWRLPEEEWLTSEPLTR
ncbi:MAG: metalloregulator ArsR/SmtB family transcription factor [Verrucomicrobia bacterium]|nr:metalloregulator ArsR/SmtB family transcription factor [Verrucomicrobiota bacterium]